MAKYKERSDICVRLPLESPRDFKAFTDGNFLYVQGVDTERLMSSIGLYTKPRISTNTTSWSRYIGNEQMQGKRSFTASDIANAIQAQLDLVVGSYRTLMDHPVVSELIKSIFNIQKIISTSEDRNFKSLEKELEQFTYQLMPSLSKMEKMVAELKEKERLNDSLTSAWDNMDEAERNKMMICGEAVLSYHASVNKLVEFESVFNDLVAGLEKEVEELGSKRMSLRAREEDLNDADELMMVVFGKASPQIVTQVWKQVNSLNTDLRTYDEERNLLLGQAASLRENLVSFTDMVKSARSAHILLKPYLVGDNLPKLYLDTWTNKETCLQVQDWANCNFHEASVWNERLSVASRKLSEIETSLNNPYDTRQVSEWVKTLAPKEQVAAALSVAVGNNHNEGNLGREVVIPRSDTTSRREPESLDDMLELTILTVARTSGANYMMSTTFHSIFVVLTMAGFNLQNISAQAFREFVKKHSQVEFLEDCKKDAKARYQKTSRYLLMFSNPNAKGPSQSKIRLKITLAGLKDQVIKPLEAKWGITVAEIVELAKERREQYTRK